MPPRTADACLPALCVCVCVCLLFWSRPIKFLLHPLILQLISKYIVQMSAFYHDRDLFVELLPANYSKPTLELFDVT